MYNILMNVHRASCERKRTEIETKRKCSRNAPRMNRKCTKMLQKCSKKESKMHQNAPEMLQKGIENAPKTENNQPEFSSVSQRILYE